MTFRAGVRVEDLLPEEAFARLRDRSPGLAVGP